MTAPDTQQRISRPRRRRLLARPHWPTVPPAHQPRPPAPARHPPRRRQPQTPPTPPTTTTRASHWNRPRRARRGAGTAGAAGLAATASTQTHPLDRSPYSSALFPAAPALPPRWTTPVMLTHLVLAIATATIRAQPAMPGPITLALKENRYLFARDGRSSVLHIGAQRKGPELHPANHENHALRLPYWPLRLCAWYRAIHANGTRLSLTCGAADTTALSDAGRGVVVAQIEHVHRHLAVVAVVGPWLALRRGLAGVRPWPRARAGPRGQPDRWPRPASQVAAAKPLGRSVATSWPCGRFV